MTIVHEVTLVPHEGTPPPAVERLAVRLGRDAAGTLRVTFVLEAELGALRIPPPRPATFVNELWQHTCFEVFVGVDGETGYHEWNLSPSGEWAAHAFRGYRDGGVLEDERPAPVLEVRARERCLELVASIPLDRLSPAHPTAPLRIGLAAVIEAAGGALSYWALHHPPGKPDFHHPAAFTLRLGPPGA